MYIFLKIPELESSLDAAFADILVIHDGTEQRIRWNDIAICTSVPKNIPDTNCYLHITIGHFFTEINPFSIM